MKTAILDLELLDDVVISARAASFGGHGSLDYLPGATLLGSVAARLYRGLEDQGLAYEAFHSGKLRFGNALPVDASGAIGWPVPRCWSHTKGSEPDQRVGESGRRFLTGAPIRNGLIRDDLATGDAARLRTLRSGYVVPATGEWLHPARNLRMKTAIHPERGRVAQGQLFGYQSIDAGQRFRAVLSADDDLSEGLFEAVRDGLIGQDLHIGRSRSAQYGRARCVLGEHGTDQLPERAEGTDTLTLWLLADLAALDADGQPTLTPNLQAFDRDLPAIELDTANSFISSRRYSPYNGFRRAHDLERQVIEQGSVLRYRLTTPLTDGQLARVAAGLGLYRETGLGAVAVNPQLLTKGTLTWPTPDIAVTRREPQRPNDPLVDWLEQRKKAASLTVGSGELHAELTKQIAELYHGARRYAGAPAKVLIGPSASQWGRVVQAARDLRSRRVDLLLDRLFNPEDGYCRDRQNESWNRPTGQAGDYATFASWLRKHCKDSEDPEAPFDLLTRLDTLARLAKEHIRAEVRS